MKPEIDAHVQQLDAEIVALREEVAHLRIMASLSPEARALAAAFDTWDPEDQQRFAQFVRWIVELEQRAAEEPPTE